MGALCALALSVVNFLRLLLVSQVGLPVAMVVSATLSLTVILSKLVGAALPILAKRMGFDPAVMASPLITTLVDALSLVAYFWLATEMLGL